jgi:hypothetical protein
MPHAGFDQQTLEDQAVLNDSQWPITELQLCELVTRAQVAPVVPKASRGLIREPLLRNGIYD